MCKVLFVRLTKLKNLTRNQLKMMSNENSFNFLDQVIYPGKVTDAETFRIGNIGHLFPEDLHHLIKCICEVLKDMNVPLPIVD